MFAVDQHVARATTVRAFVDRPIVAGRVSSSSAWTTAKTAHSYRNTAATVITFVLLVKKQQQLLLAVGMVLATLGVMAQGFVCVMLDTVLPTVALRAQ